MQVIGYVRVGTKTRSGGGSVSPECSAGEAGGVLPGEGLDIRSGDPGRRV